MKSLSIATRNAVFSTDLDISKIPVYTGNMQNEKLQPGPDAYKRVVSMCINANLRKTSRAITQLYDEFLQPSGLLGTQFRLLGAVASNDPIALAPLAEELTLDPTTLARNLKPLERDGLVEISVGEDRRTRMVTITEKGQESLLKAFPLWEEAQTWVISHIGEDHWRTMLADWNELTSLVRER
jgi:DNA-binding MarR family transcriptional regulator